MRAPALIVITLLAQAAQAGPPELILPVDCTLGKDCYIQNYVDADPQAGYRDFACGSLSYNGHKGTDFAVPTHLDALAGVAVLAAANGRVIAVRDGVQDHFLGAKPEHVENQDCGNGVLIDHGNGWETQYCHLAKDSVSVARGQEIPAGTILGQMGMSGRTEFPHLHLSLRKDGQVVDPFDPIPDQTCGAPMEDQIWKTPIPYGAGAVLQVGFSSDIPDFDQIKFGNMRETNVSVDQGGLVLWAHLYGTRAGDSLKMTIDGPNGVFIDHTETFDRSQAQSMRAAGRRLDAANTVPGQYEGRVLLVRDGKELSQMTVQATLLE